MRVVIDPDSLKGTIHARAAAAALAGGWRSVRPADEVLLVPMADGGPVPAPRRARVRGPGDVPAVRIPGSMSDAAQRAARTSA